eukprot:UN01946
MPGQNNNTGEHTFNKPQILPEFSVLQQTLQNNNHNSVPIQNSNQMNSVQHQEMPVIINQNYQAMQNNFVNQNTQNCNNSQLNNINIKTKPTLFQHEC